MATLSTTSSGRKVIQFRAIAGKGRRTISLGNVSRLTAETAREHVAELVRAKRTGEAPRSSTENWLEGISDDLHARIAKVQLAETRQPSGTKYLGAFMSAYIKGRTDLKPRTISIFNQTRDALVGFFGEDEALHALNRGRMGDWHRAMKLKYSTATIAVFVKKARQMFKDAVDRKLISDNPARELKTGAMNNPARQRYVPSLDIEKVISACPDVQWSLIFALARYAGLRVPSETSLLKWSDIDWNTLRMVVTSPKTAHIQGKDHRIVPIVPELYPHLRAAFEIAPDGSRHCITLHRGQNLGTTAKKIIERAGFTPWPRVFQNLRSSCETDFSTKFPLPVACVWIGNTEAVARKHYLIVTDDHFNKATGLASAAQSAAPTSKGNKKSPQIEVYCGPEYELSLDPLPPREREAYLRKLLKWMHRHERALRKTMREIADAAPHIMAADLARLQRQIANAKGEIQ